MNINQLKPKDMTRKQEIEKIASAFAIDEVKDTCNPASKRGLLYAGFVSGAEWADAHPHWISVEDELPMEHEWILGYSLKREYIDVYNFDSNGLIEAHGITHWMHLSPPPIITSSKEGGEE